MFWQVHCPNTDLLVRCPHMDPECYLKYKKTHPVSQKLSFLLGCVDAHKHGEEATFKHRRAVKKQLWFDRLVEVEPLKLDLINKHLRPFSGQRGWGKHST